MTPLLSDLLIFGGIAIVSTIIAVATELLHGYLDQRGDR